jgi:4,4'-diaponeurosporenoate glycosyltransferase
MLYPMEIYPATLLARWILGWFIWRPFRELKPQKAKSSPKIAVIIPARNEAKNIAKLLNSLNEQTYKNFETLVIDDHSTDATKIIAQNLNFRVLQSEDLPPGWTGKSFALWQGVQATDSELLLFIDADCQLSPNLIESLLAEYEKTQGIVSLQPFHKTQKSYENLSSVFNLIGALGAKLGKASGQAFGPCLLISRKDYINIGTHQAIKEQVLEDRALGQLAQKNSLTVRALAGGELISFRMYPDGLKSLSQGFIKNMAQGSVGLGFWPFVLLFAWFSGLAAAAWELPFAFLAWPFTQVAPSLYQYLLTIGFGIQFFIMTRRLGNFGLSIIWYPLQVAFFLIIFFTSVFKTANGTVIWKGRAVSSKP